MTVRFPKVAAVLLVVLLSFVGCGAWCCSPSTGAVERAIERELKPGDPEERVVAFFEEHGWPYGYDDMRNCYGARSKELDRCDGLSKVKIYVYLDEERRFVRAEVEVVYTFI